MSDANLTKREIARIKLSLEILAHAVSTNSVNHGFWDTEIDQNVAVKISLMHAELSEALECYRNNEPLLWFKYPNEVKSHKPTLHASECVIGDTDENDYILGKPEGIASEFADTIIRILDTAYHENIPVIEALIYKHQYNLTRPHRHGSKTC